MEDPAIRWQMALYKDLPNRPEDSADPEKTVERVLDIASVLFHLEQVRLAADWVWFAPPVDDREDVCQAVNHGQTVLCSEHSS